VGIAAGTLAADRWPGRYGGGRRDHATIRWSDRGNRRAEIRDEHLGFTVELVPGARTGLPYRDLPDQQHLT
jgi:hypothetical protein